MKLPNFKSEIFKPGQIVKMNTILFFFFFFNEIVIVFFVVAKNKQINKMLFPHQKHFQVCGSVNNMKGQYALFTS